jgi:fatty acid desaturase
MCVPPAGAPLIGRLGGGGKGAVGDAVYLHDAVAVRNEFLFRPPARVARFIVSRLADERDAPIAFLFFDIVVTMVPAFVALFAIAPPSHLLGAAYVATFDALYLQRFILAMHYSTHRRLLKRRDGLVAAFFNRVNILLLAPLFGVPCGVYWLHHIVMHHVDSNEIRKDLSSTEGYRRDSVTHWLLYWIRFTVGSWVELPWYAFARRRYALCAGVIAGLTASVCAFLRLYTVNPTAAIWTLAVPYVVSSVAMMLGNWSQHAFVKVDDDGGRDDYRSSVTVLNHPDQQRTFNDGFHALHHVNSRLHWSEFPGAFVEKLAEHGANDAVVFSGVHFMDVGVNLFLGRYGHLADRYVNVGQPKRTREELIAMLKERVQPVKVKTKTS